jgi:hypothetical protein
MPTTAGSHYDSHLSYHNADLTKYAGRPGNLQTARYGLAAVSSDPKPFPITKVAAQKPPNERYTRHGQASSAPTP